MILSKVIHPCLLKPEAWPVLLLHCVSNAVSNAPPHGAAWVSFSALSPLLFVGTAPFPLEPQLCAHQLLACPPCSAWREVSLARGTLAQILLGCSCPWRACSALAGGCVIPRGDLREHRRWEGKHQPCGYEPRDELAPSSSLRMLL